MHKRFTFEIVAKTLQMVVLGGGCLYQVSEMKVKNQSYTLNQCCNYDFLIFLRSSKNIILSPRSLIQAEKSVNSNFMNLRFCQALPNLILRISQISQITVVALFFVAFFRVRVLLLSGFSPAFSPAFWGIILGSLIVGWDGSGSGISGLGGFFGLYAGAGRSDNKTQNGQNTVDFHRDSG